MARKTKEEAPEVILGLLLDLSWPYQAGSSKDKAYLRHTQHCSDFLSQCAQLSLNGLTLNINANLVKSWVDGEAGPVGFIAVENLKSALRYGLAELTGCAAHHPILPLLHTFEMRRQVAINSAVLQRLIHHDWVPHGFFPPELAFGHEILGPLGAMGFGWCLSDDAAYATLHGEVPTNWIAQMSGLAILLRSRMWSEKLRHLNSKNAVSLAESLVCETAKWMGQKHGPGGGYLAVALHRDAVEGQLAKALKKFFDCLQPPWRIEHLSQLVGKFPKKESQVPPSSWFTSSEEFWRGEFFARWKSEQTSHQILWRLAELSWSNVERLRELLDEAMCSVTFEEQATERGVAALLAVLGAGQPQLQSQIQSELEVWLAQTKLSQTSESGGR